MSDLQTALALHRQGRLTEAVQLYLRLLRRTPDHPEILHLLGVARHQQGHHQEAIDLIGRAVALRPGVASFHCNLGEAHRALGNLDAAAACYLAALQAKPEYPEARNNLGVAFERTGRLKEAAGCYRRAYEIAAAAFAPDHPSVMTSRQNLAEFYETHGQVMEPVAVTAPAFTSASVNV